jgi:hypothetical protein
VAEKSLNPEDLVGKTVLHRTTDGIRQATITSVSPSKKFLYAGEGNTWIDPAQVIEVLTDEPIPTQP